VRQLAAAATRAAERGARLNASLLAFSRKQRLKPEAADANVLLREFALLVRRAVGETVQVELELDPTLPLCRTDTAQLEAAILNLAINARDAMAAAGGGSLVIATRSANLTTADLASNADALPGTFIAIAVADTGPGMAPEVLKQAFDPFFTTKGVGEGSGLGLSQVYGFARQSGGHVTIDSEPGAGTRVTLYLPVAADAVAAPATGPMGAIATSVVALTPTTVLVVEDDEDVREVTRASLHAIGCRVLAATDGHEALAIVERGEAIDLLFSDVVMPGGMSGIELAREARRQRPGLKVLLTSGYSAAALERHAAEGEFAVLAKPYRQADLVARVQAALARHAEDAASRTS
jgi:CheY-like chemotaxis protein